MRMPLCIEEFAAMLTQFGLLSKALDGSLYEEDTLSYNSILVSTVANQNVVIRLRVWQ